jgi:peptidoglycan/LPS O-acetylase OafA/YrhL
VSVGAQAADGNRRSATTQWGHCTEPTDPLGDQRSANEETVYGDLIIVDFAAQPKTITGRFDPRDNGLNAIRLVLAFLVIISHSWSLGGFGYEPRLGDATIGRFAVGGFFAISGFLVTGSRLRLSAGAYGWRRFLRIFPALWVCLLVTAFVLAPAVGALRGGWSLSATIRYVSGNSPTVFGLTNEIGTTLRDVPVPSWNGSLWTLRHEVACYILIGLAAFSGTFRSKRWLTAAGFGAATGMVIVFAVTEMSGLFLTFALLLAFFLAGSVLLRYGDRIPLTNPMAGLAIVLFAVTIITHTINIFGPLPVAYLCLWTATVLTERLRKIGSRNDLSYGVYLYGFPVQQLLFLIGTSRLGPFAFAGLSCVAAVPFAAMSWLLVERPAMRMKEFGRWSGVLHRALPGNADPTPRCPDRLTYRRSVQDEGESAHGAAAPELRRGWTRLPGRFPRR